MRTRFPRRSAIIGVIILGGLMLGLQQGWFNPVRTFTLRATGYVMRGSAFAIHESLAAARSLFRLRELSRSLRLLEEDNARLQARIARQTDLERENDELRRQLELLPRAEYRLVTADVLSRSTDGIRDALIINRGTRAGIQEGMPVIVYDGIVVGRIERVHSHTAIVMLLTDPSSRLAVRTHTSGVEGVLRGVRGLDVVLESVPRTAELRIDEHVVTSGADGVFPPGLLVGTVRRTEGMHNDIFQSASVSTTVDVRRVRTVGIIVNTE